MRKPKNVSAAKIYFSVGNPDERNITLSELQPADKEKKWEHLINLKKMNSSQLKNAERPASGYQRRPPKPPQISTFSPKAKKGFSNEYMDNSPLVLPMKSNPRIKSTMLLDNYQNAVVLNQNEQKCRQIKELLTKRGDKTKSMFYSSVYDSITQNKKKKLSRNSMSEIGKICFVNSKVGRDSQLSFNSHNSSFSNLSFASLNSPVRATRDSFDIDMVRKQADKIIVNSKNL